MRKSFSEDRSKVRRSDDIAAELLALVVDSTYTGPDSLL